MNEEALKKALNHHCFKCPNLKTKDFKRCYCDLTGRRVFFKEDDFSNCPILYIAYSEINTPCYEIGTYFKMKDDEHIYCITKAFFNIDLGQYEYFCNILVEPHHFEGGVSEVNHSRIVEIISPDDVRVKGRH